MAASRFVPNHNQELSKGKESAFSAGELVSGKIPWRREQLFIPVFWPGEFHGSYSPWGHKELDMTEQLSFFLLLHLEALITPSAFPLASGLPLEVCFLVLYPSKETRGRWGGDGRVGH